MNSKQKRIYDLIFKNPVQSNIEWKEIENLLKSLGAKILYLDMPKIDISSTNIRQSVANMIPISNEVPYEVEQYILKEKLYYEKNI